MKQNLKETEKNECKILIGKAGALLLRRSRQSLLQAGD